LSLDIRAIFNAPNGDEAKRQLDLFIDKYQTSMPKTSSNFLAAFDTMADETLVPHIDSMILLTFRE
jgi:transposase-like protein